MYWLLFNDLRLIASVKRKLNLKIKKDAEIPKILYYII